MLTNPTLCGTLLHYNIEQPTTLIHCISVTYANFQAFGTKIALLPVMFENDKLPLRKKIVLSLGLLVAAITLIFAQYSGIKAKSDIDGENNMRKKESIQPDLKGIKDGENLIDSSNNTINNGSNEKSRKSNIPKKTSNTDNRLFESI